MATRVERTGIEGCVNSAAKTIDDTMNELPDYWEGAAYDKASSTYEDEYKTLLTTTVPEAVESFNDYIDKCMKKIIEIDEKLAGNQKANSKGIKTRGACE